MVQLDVHNVLAIYHPIASGRLLSCLDLQIQMSLIIIKTQPGRQRERTAAKRDQEAAFSAEWKQQSQVGKML